MRIKKTFMWKEADRKKKVSIARAIFKYLKINDKIVGVNNLCILVGYNLNPNKINSV